MHSTVFKLEEFVRLKGLNRSSYSFFVFLVYFKNPEAALLTFLSYIYLLLSFKI